MRKHRLEVADVVCQHGEQWMERWGRCASPQQRKALHDIGICRTAALGGHVEQCDSCSQRLVAYNSCRNRHCPKCQSSIGVSLLESLSLLTIPAPCLGRHPGNLIGFAPEADRPQVRWQRPAGSGTAPGDGADPALSRSHGNEEPRFGVTLEPEKVWLISERIDRRWQPKTSSM